MGSLERRRAAGCAYLPEMWSSKSGLIEFWLSDTPRHGTFLSGGLVPPLVWRLEVLSTRLGSQYAVNSTRCRGCGHGPKLILYRDLDGPRLCWLGTDDRVGDAGKRHG